MAVQVTIYHAVGGGKIIVPSVLPTSEDKAKEISRELRKAGLSLPHFVAWAGPPREEESQVSIPMQRPDWLVHVHPMAALVKRNLLGEWTVAILITMKS